MMELRVIKLCVTKCVIKSGVMKQFRLLSLMLALVMVGACSEEQQNKLTRLGVTWLEGDYRVTYAAGSHSKTWEVRDGKVTTEPAKGYYYFWAITEDGKKYVQSPIERTYIEEIN